MEAGEVARAGQLARQNVSLKDQLKDFQASRQKSEEDLRSTHKEDLAKQAERFQRAREAWLKSHEKESKAKLQKQVAISEDLSRQVAFREHQLEAAKLDLSRLRDEYEAMLSDLSTQMGKAEASAKRDLEKAQKEGVAARKELIDVEAALRRELERAQAECKNAKKELMHVEATMRRELQRARGESEVARRELRDVEAATKRELERSQAEHEAARKELHDVELAAKRELERSQAEKAAARKELQEVETAAKRELDKSQAENEAARQELREAEAAAKRNIDKSQAESEVRRKQLQSVEAAAKKELESAEEGDQPEESMEDEDTRGQRLVKMLGGALRKAQDERDTVRQELLESEEQCRRLSENVGELTVQLQKSIDDHEAKSQELLKLQEEVDQVRRELWENEVGAELERLNNELSGLGSEVQKWHGINDMVLQEADPNSPKHQTKRGRDRGQRAGDDVDEVLHENQLSEAKRVREEFQRELEASEKAKAQKAKMTTELVQIRFKYAMTNTQLMAKKMEVEKLKAALEARDSELAALKNSTGEPPADGKEVRQEAARADEGQSEEHQVRQQQLELSKIQADRDALAAQISRLREEIASAQAECGAARRASAAKQAEVEELSSAIAARDSELAQLRQECDVARRQSIAQETKVEELSVAVAARDSELAQLRQMQGEPLQESSKVSGDSQVLTEQISRVDREVVDALGERDAAKRELASKENDVEQLNIKANRRDSELMMLRHERAKQHELGKEPSDTQVLVEQVARLERQVVDMRGEKDAAKRDLATRDKEVEQLKSTASACQAELQRLQQERARQQEPDQEPSDNQVLVEQVSRLEREVQEVLGERDVAKCELATKQIEVQELNSTAAPRDSELTLFRQEQAKQLEPNQEPSDKQMLVEQVSHLEQELTKMTSDSSSLVEQLNRLEREVVGLQGERDAAARDLGVKEKEVEQLHGRMAAEHSELVLLRQERARQLQEPDQEPSDNRTLVEQVSRLERVVLDLQGERDDAKRELATTDQEMERLKKTSGASDNEPVLSEQQRAEHLRELGQAQSDNHGLVEQVSRLHAEVQAMQVERDFARRELARSGKEVEQLKSIVVSRDSEPVPLQQERARRVAEPGQAPSDNQALVEQVSRLERDVVGIQAERDAARRELATSEKEVEQLKSTAASRNSQLVLLQQEKARHVPEPGQAPSDSHALLEHVSRLEQEVLGMQAERDAARSQMATQERDVEQLKGVVAARDSELVLLRRETREPLQEPSDNQWLIDQVSRLEQELVGMQGERDAARRELDTKTKEVERHALSDSQSRCEQVSHLEKEVLSMQADRDAAKRELAAKETEVEQLKSIATALDSKLARSQREWAVHSSKVASDNQTLVDQVSRLEQEVLGMQAERDAARSQMATQEREVEQLKGAVAGMQGARNAARRELDTKTKEVERQALSDSQSRGEQVSHLENEVLSMQADRDAAKRDLAAKDILGMQEERDATRSQLATQEKEIEQLKGMVAERDSKIALVQRETKEPLHGQQVSSDNQLLVEQVGRLKLVVDNIQEERDAARRALSAKEKEVEQLNSAVTARDSELKLLRHEPGESLHELGQASSDSQSRVDHVSSLQKEVLSLQTELDAAKRELVAKEKEVEQLKSTAAALDSKFATTQHERAGHSKDSGQAPLDTHGLVEQVSRLERDVLGIRGERDVARSQLVTKEKEVEHLKGMVAERDSKLALLRQEPATPSHESALVPSDGQRLLEQVVRFERELVVVRGERDDARYELAARKKQVEQLHIAAAARDSELVQLQQDRAKYWKELASALSVNQEKAERVSRLEVENDAARRELAAKQMELEQLSTAASARGSELALLRSGSKAGSAVSERDDASRAWPKIDPPSDEASKLHVRRLEQDILACKVLQASQEEAALNERREKELLAVKLENLQTSLSALDNKHADLMVELASERNRADKLQCMSGGPPSTLEISFSASPKDPRRNTPPTRPESHASSTTVMSRLSPVQSLPTQSVQLDKGSGYLAHAQQPPLAPHRPVSATGMAIRSSSNALPSLRRPFSARGPR